MALGTHLFHYLGRPRGLGLPGLEKQADEPRAVGGAGFPDIGGRADSVHEGEEAAGRGGAGRDQQKRQAGRMSGGDEKWMDGKPNDAADGMVGALR